MRLIVLPFGACHAHWRSYSGEMQKAALALFCCALSLGCLQAQVTVEVTQSQDQFLPGESMPTAVRVKNLSGHALHLGEEPDWLTFTLEPLDGGVVVQNADVPVAGPFDLASSKVATKRLDLAPYFSINKPGRYRITATVKIKNWSDELKSEPLRFNIIHGAVLWSQEFGLPASSGAAERPPEVRKYILQQANYLKGQVRLYLRVTDPSEARIFRVVNIGVLRSFSQPEHQIDSSSNLHVLYASGPQRDGAPGYLYSVFNPDGELLSRQTYEFIDSRPRLQVDENGKISVAGKPVSLSSNQQH